MEYETNNPNLYTCPRCFMSFPRSTLSEFELDGICPCTQTPKFVEMTVNKLPPQISHMFTPTPQNPRSILSASKRFLSFIVLTIYVLGCLFMNADLVLLSASTKLKPKLLLILFSVLLLALLLLTPAKSPTNNIHQHPDLNSFGIDTNTDGIRPSRIEGSNIVINTEDKRDASLAFDLLSQLLKEQALQTSLIINELKSKAGQSDVIHLQGEINKLSQKLEEIDEELSNRNPQSLDEEMLQKAVNEAVSKITQFEVSPTSDVMDGFFDKVKRLIREQIELFAADRVGLPDFALESHQSAIVHSLTSPTYTSEQTGLGYYWKSSLPPETIINPDVTPGNCWAFAGKTGNVTIEMRSAVFPFAFSIDHISPKVSAFSAATSAPKAFRVWGLKSEYDPSPVLLGRYVFELSETKTVQTFPIQIQTDEKFKLIKLNILDNHGHKDYTCIYRFRIHAHTLPPKS